VGKVRRFSALVLVAGLAALACLAWWSMLAAERGALRANQTGAQHTAVATALAVQVQQASGGDVAGFVRVAEATTGVHLLVRDTVGTVVAGTASSADRLVTVPVPGSSLSVSAAVDSTAGLGLGQYSHLITAGAFLVMACSVGMLVIVGRDRRAARAELERLGRRWNEVAAADDLTGLGNRTRLLEDVQALIARGTRYGNSFGLALFEVPGDPDDQEIVTVAEILAAEARSADVCYRVTANRFVTLLPEQDDTGATLAAQRIRGSLAAHAGVEVHHGVSAFSPWRPRSAGDLLVSAELDLGASVLLGADIPERENLPEVAVTPRP
jgi:GGDEF domain-containing protein